MRPPSTRALVRRGAVAMSALFVTAFAAAAPTAPVGPLERLNDASPVLSPTGDGFESAGTFNPTVVKKDGKFVMLYRAQDHQGKSSLGYATSEDGIHFVTRP